MAQLMAIAAGMRIGAVVLAGGEGRRIGGGKPHRRLAGRTLLDHVLDRARGWRIPLAVSLREAPGPAQALSCPVLLDAQGEGPIAGIAAALRFAGEERLDGVLTMPCDTPFLPDDLPARLIAALRPPRLAAMARSGGRIHPSCTLWSAAARAQLAPYLASGGSSLTGFARLLEAGIADWPDAPVDPFFNVNSAADLAAAEAMLKMR